MYDCVLSTTSTERESSGSQGRVSLPGHTYRFCLSSTSFFISLSDVSLIVRGKGKAMRALFGELAVELGEALNVGYQPYLMHVTLSSTVSSRL